MIRTAALAAGVLLALDGPDLGGLARRLGSADPAERGRAALGLRGGGEAAAGEIERTLPDLRGTGRDRAEALLAALRGEGRVAEGTLLARIAAVEGEPEAAADRLAAEFPGPLASLLGDPTLRFRPGDPLPRAFVAARARRPDPDRARRALAEAASRGEADPVLLTERGILRRDTGDLDGAEADLARALELDARFVRARVARAWLRWGREDAEGALADAERAALRGAAAPEALEARARLLLLAGRADRARTAAEEALAADPSRPDPWHVRARAREAAGDVAGARSDYAAALARAPWHAGAALDWGRSLATAGRVEEARQVLSEGAAAGRPGSIVVEQIEAELRKLASPPR
ncbi:MAG: hypothetical protein L0216_20410 [Planctomycetales bacterium]|nr:hypothetical protein [Planctomycetales bacterium]